MAVRNSRQSDRRLPELIQDMAIILPQRLVVLNKILKLRMGTLLTPQAK
jgi:hypothetical protein